MNKELPFRTAYSGQKRTTCPTGKETKKTYAYEINEKGQKELKVNGMQNVYEEIQAELEETKIENILKRVASGDMSDFRPTGIYQDITEIPNNLIEAKKEMQKLENFWNELPKEVKAKYNWSVDEFIANAGKETWLKDTGLINQSADEPTVNQAAQTTEEEEVTKE